MNLTFHGAAGEVTGSCTMLDTGRSRILVDCGLFHSADAVSRNRRPFPFDISTVDAVLITHAHLDHLGLLPRLIHDGYSGPIYTIDATRRLARYMWEDAARVQSEETEGTGDGPLYEERDIERAMTQTHGVTYGDLLTLPGGVKVRFRDAGHILGSAFIEAEVGGVHLVFSGDIGTDDVPIIRNTEPLKRADVVVLESTYGAREHEPASGRVDLLKKALLDTVERKGVLMIPAFSLERTQELLYELNGLFEGRGLKRIPIFLDAPLATNILPVYREFSKYYDHEAELTKLAGDDFFRFPGLKVTRKTRQSLKIEGVRPPKVIIAGSGMMGGGRIVRHLANYLEGEENMVLVIGYQAERTRGRAILEGAETVEVDGTEVEVNAEIRKINGYSAHGDSRKLLSWIDSAGKAPQKVFMNHGELDQSEALAAAAVEGEHAKEALVPEEGVTYDL